MDHSLGMYMYFATLYQKSHLLLPGSQFHQRHNIHNLILYDAVVKDFKEDGIIV